MSEIKYIEKPNIKLVEEKAKELLDAMELNKTVPFEHLNETPNRIARMFLNEMFSGCYTPPPKITTFSNQGSKCEIIVENITCNSTCAHHFVPFVGHASIMYMPNDKVVGLSKFSRVVDYFAKKPQIQELLTNQIKNFLVEVLDPEYLFIVISCKHMCMNVRGVEDSSSYTTTSAYHIPEGFVGVSDKLDLLKSGLIRP